MRVLIFIAAVALFLITVSFVEYLGPLILGIDGPDPARMQEAGYLQDFMSRQPAAAFIMVAIAHFVASVVGGMVVGLGRLGMSAMWLLGIICTLAGLANLLLVPGHPIWFWILDLPLYLGGVWLGYRWVSRTRQVVAERVPS